MKMAYKSQPSKSDCIYFINDILIVRLVTLNDQKFSKLYETALIHFYFSLAFTLFPDMNRSEIPIQPDQSLRSVSNIFALWFDFQFDQHLINYSSYVSDSLYENY